MNKFFEDIMPRGVTVKTDDSDYENDPSIRFHYVDADGDKAIVVVSDSHFYMDTTTSACGVNFTLQAWRYFMCVMEDLQQQVLKSVPA